MWVNTFGQRRDHHIPPTTHIYRPPSPASIFYVLHALHFVAVFVDTFVLTEDTFLFNVRMLHTHTCSNIHALCFWYQHCDRSEKMNKIKNKIPKSVSSWSCNQEFYGGQLSVAHRSPLRPATKVARRTRNVKQPIGPPVVAKSSHTSPRSTRANPNHPEPKRKQNGSPPKREYHHRARSQFPKNRLTRKPIRFGDRPCPTNT